MPDTYDYVVVGGGSAGAVVASRLSENPAVQVALIEAGGTPDSAIYDIPALWPRQLTSDADWGFLSEPEPGLHGRRIYLPRGKGLGGTSSLNAMVYIRGAHEDYDAWSAAGATGWSWDDVLPFFLRSEDNQRGPSAFHAVDGPLGVEDRRSDSRIVEAWVRAAVAAGHPLNDDFNGAQQDGVGFFQVTTRNGQRSSTYKAFLEPATTRDNLTVITHARATRVLIEDDRARGVELIRDGRVRTLSATQEVVLSAGAYASPHLLLLSGIGPRAQLERHGVRCILDLPVGENLQDHFGAATVVATSIPTLVTVGSEQDWQLYNSQRRGPLASNIVEAGLFDRAQPDAAHPDLEFCVLATGWSEDGLGEETEPAFAVWTEILRPHSRGAVTLRSSEPSARPRIRHNHLTTQHDRDVLIEGVRRNVHILWQDAVQRYLTKDIQLPAGDSDEDVLQFIQDVGTSLYHPSSTCAIGSVVDSQLRVFGISGLRIADASIMPQIVSGNPNAPTIMIGERAADFIRAAAKDKP